MCALALAYGIREQAQAVGLTDPHQIPLTCHLPTPTHADAPCDQSPQGVDGPGGGRADAGLWQLFAGPLGVPGAPWHLRGAVAAEGAHFPRSPVAAGHRLAPGRLDVRSAGFVLAGPMAADCLRCGAAPAAVGWSHRHQFAGCVPAFRQRCPEAFRAQAATGAD